MSKRSGFFGLCLFLAVLGYGTYRLYGAQLLAAAVGAPALARPHYQIDAAVDYELLTFKSSASIDVPVERDDALRDVVFFIYANAGGIGGDDGAHKYIAVDSVKLANTASGEDEKVGYKLDGAVLRVQLPQPQSQPFQLKIDYHGVVPRSPAGSGGIMDMMGGLGGDISGMLGGMLGGEQAQPPKPKNVDYGLYTYGDGIVSLGSFWYPSLAVRQGGRWVDEAPTGLGDVGYCEMSDFDVNIKVPPAVKIAATGDRLLTSNNNIKSFRARNVRDFAVLMSDRFVVNSKTIALGERKVLVESYTTKEEAGKGAKALDVAANALQIYSRRFGPYIYDSFKVVQGPIKGGAGGMEFSGMTSIASMLYQDLGKQMNELSGSLGLGNLDQVMNQLGLGDDDGTAAAKGAPTAKGSPAKQGTSDKAATVKTAAAPEIPAADMLGGLLGQQKEMFESLLETTVAHEVGHQWWAMAVGSDSQRAPFVDESLTNYTAMLYYEDRYGRDTARKMIDLNLKTTYSMGRMMGGGDAPANLSSAAYGNNIQYGAVVYGKGALYYDALRKLMGDQAFFAALRQYYARYNLKLAPSSGLLQIAKQESPAKAAQIDALFKRWIQEKHGDEDISGGQVTSVMDMLGGLLGGLTSGME